MRLHVLDLGLVGYDVARKLQDDYAREIAAGLRLPTLLLLEHPHVYTFGRKGHSENSLWTAQQLQQRSVAVRWVDRGGDVTYHGPGQLIGYPLVPLGTIRQSPGAPEAGAAGSLRIPHADFVGYLRQLEAVLIEALAQFGLAAGQIPGLTGVWIQPNVYSRCPRCRPEDRQKPAKIAAIGVKVDFHGISRAGFALNVNPDRTYWDGIIACGIADHPVVSLSDLVSTPPAMPEVKRCVASAFAGIFNFTLH
jgi:lipoyl(octanoyl) transferase